MHYRLHYKQSVTVCYDNTIRFRYKQHEVVLSEEQFLNFADLLRCLCHFRHLKWFSLMNHVWLHSDKDGVSLHNGASYFRFFTSSWRHYKRNVHRLILSFLRHGHRESHARDDRQHNYRPRRFAPLYKDSSRLYRGRPEMLLLRMSNNRNVQLFRKGKIQILGALSEETTEQMTIECLSKVRQLLPNFQLTPATTANMVLRVAVPHTVTRKLTSSNSSVCYEPELFPAILLTNWAPVHVHVFHNGKALITGVKSLGEANFIYEDLLDFIHSLPSEK
mgnify:CR=1 FL=1